MSLLLPLIILMHPYWIKMYFFKKIQMKNLIDTKNIAVYN